MALKILIQSQSQQRLFIDLRAGVFMLQILQNLDENPASFFTESQNFFDLQLTLSEKAKDIINDNCQVEVYKTGETLFHQNQIAENLYFLVKILTELRNSPMVKGKRKHQV